MHVVIHLKAQIHNRAALTRAALAAMERAWGAPDDEDRRALGDPANALYELLWASHPTAGPRRAEALGFEVVDSSRETHVTPEPVDDRARADHEEVDEWRDSPVPPPQDSSLRRGASSRRSGGT